DLIHKVPRGDSVAFVLPRTLLEWRQAHSKKDAASASDDEAGSWEKIPEKNITISKAKARLIVQMAVELDCTKLQSLWTKAKVWQTGALDFATWLEHRERFVVVLTGPIADRYWMAGQKDLYLCNIDLRVVGSKGGRPPKPVSSNRGWSSAALHWTSEREQECELQRREAKRQATAFAPQPPANISPGQATDALSDAAAQTCRQTEAEATAVAAVDSPPAARAPSGMAEEAAAPSHPGRGRTVHGTNFATVFRVLAGRRLPADSNIYYNAGNSAP
ncbi:Nlrc3, partial [Symbiodinium sp. CCMP2592]